MLTTKNTTMNYKDKYRKEVTLTIKKLVKIYENL